MQTWPKTKRLLRPADFARVKDKGAAHRRGTLMLGVLKVAGETGFRVGFVTSKRIGGAVVRNRVRRRLREIVRTHQDSLRPGVWLVVIARRSAVAASLRDLEHDWLRLAERASILAP
ncbi:MAG: ribonuclease P protein component [Verrucomicrobiota bacterium]|nr:ribonuclease P protein component [Verrucomicrobiota bacterium]